MIGALLTSLRPRQWVKNLVIFAAIIFSGNALDWQMQAKVWAAFAAFCAVVGSGYILNDILDRSRDRVHPEKCRRPIASGRLGTGVAVTAAVILTTGALAGSLAVDYYLTISLAAYMVLQTIYALFAKHVVILDVMFIAAGFILRAVAGAAVIHVDISPWLIVCAMLLALFLALAKRRAELVLLEGEAASHRRNLEHYSIDLVDQMTVITAAATVVSYAIYSFDVYESGWMMITIPFVLYGVFRYLYLVHKHLKGGSPEQVLFTDKPLLVNIVLWAAAAEAVIYWSAK